MLATTAMTATLVVGTAATVAPQATADVGAAVVTITYSDARAGEFKDAVAQGVAVWNANVTSVRIQKAASGQRADVQVIADPGWPRATLGPVRPGGSGTVWYGREAVADGYNLVRIASHEFGHILGLPDIKPGPCSSLMSGSTGGVSCTNVNPNASERNRVQSIYANGFAPTATNTVVIG
ncbi:snapalysin family zinc-dependent metalloprotease [Actinophytocola oryzae]|uniref:snapalysin family zinc-dependent metalloprotease n=1 Tax=Actinophytocola oryzae TaxID=502181 RepID=UPI001FBAC0E6|nr:snapalysin family zinc-dependent metalloprotease [Actinophytocola oryzae]